MAEVLNELADLMEERAMILAEKAVEDKASWLKRLGAPPASEDAHRRWLHEVRTVAAYRDRYQAERRRTLGAPTTVAQTLDAARAERAIRRARAISEEAANAEDGHNRTVEQRERVLA